MIALAPAAAASAAVQPSAVRTAQGGSGAGRRSAQASPADRAVGMLTRAMRSSAATRRCRALYPAARAAIRCAAATSGHEAMPTRRAPKGGLSGGEATTARQGSDVGTGSYPRGQSCSREGGRHDAPYDWAEQASRTGVEARFRSRRRAAIRRLGGERLQPRPGGDGSSGNNEELRESAEYLASYVADPEAPARRA